MEVVQEEAKQIRAKAVITAVRYLIVGALLAALCFEGYYIFLLRKTIKKQTEDLRNISVQIQLLKSERETLREEISSAKKHTGEKDDGNTGQR
jgi:outer membrane murein-binding lipoprotein Lpp